MVILVVAEADLVSDFQQHFASRGVTIRFAEDPSATREAVAAQRPRLVVLPVEGACQVLLEAWEQGETPADQVLGLVAQHSDASSVPKSVTRTARRGETQEIVSLADLMLRSIPAQKKPAAAAKEPAAAAKEPAASIWNKPGGILKNLDADKLVDEDGKEEEEGDLDFDPSRVSDIRSLGVAVRMAKAVKSSDSGPLPGPAPSLSLSHSGEQDDEDEQGKPAGITDAMSLLPQARAAESEEETIARLAAERASQPVEAMPVARDPTLPPIASETEVVFRKSRKGLIITIVVVLVLAGGGVGAYLFLRPKPKKSKSGAAAPVAKVKKPASVKRGLHEDHFAGTIAQLPKTVTALDVDLSDEFLNRSVPELNPYMELALKRLSRSKRRKTLMERGMKLLGWERYPEARRFLKQAVELKDGPKARAGLSRAYEGLGRNWAAIVHLRHALKRDKKNDSYNSRLGLLYLRENKKKKGCMFLKRAAKLKKSHGGLLEKHCGKGKSKKRRRRRRRRRR